MVGAPVVRLTELGTLAEHNPRARRLLARLREAPWCHSAAPARVGEVLLVSVQDGAPPRDELWVLRPAGDGTPLSDTSSRELTALRDVAARDVPLLLCPRELWRRREWSATLLYSPPEAGGRTDHLDGRSYGLAMVLAHASLLVGVAAPPDVIGCAAVDPDGTLGRVDGLARKLQVVADIAVEVHRVFVASEQAAEARHHLSRIAGGDGVEVVPCGTAREALAIAFPAGVLDVGADTAGDLFRLALDGAPKLLGWQAVVRAAEAVLRGADVEQRRQASIALAIAARHTGASSLLELPVDIAPLPRPLRLRLAAHALQSASDGYLEHLPDRMELARGLLASPGERHEEDLALLGALGRAHASLGQWDDARDALTDALDGWHQLHREEGSSYALSEYLRVLGIQRDSASLRAVAPRYVDRLLLDPRARDDSVAFVRYNQARAWLLCGEPARALGLLTDRLVTSVLVDGMRMREPLLWTARALAALGETEGAEGVHALLEELRPGCEEDARVRTMARLARALRRGEDHRPHLVALVDEARDRESWAQFRRIAGLVPPADASATVAQRLLDEARD